MNPRRHDHLPHPILRSGLSVALSAPVSGPPPGFELSGCTSGSYDHLSPPEGTEGGPMVVRTGWSHPGEKRQPHSGCSVRDATPRSVRPRPPGPGPFSPIRAHNRAHYFPGGTTGQRATPAPCSAGSFRPHPVVAPLPNPLTARTTVDRSQGRPPIPNPVAAIVGAQATKKNRGSEASSTTSRHSPRGEPA